MQLLQQIAAHLYGKDILPPFVTYAQNPTDTLGETIAFEWQLRNQKFRFTVRRRSGGSTITVNGVAKRDPLNFIASRLRYAAYHALPLDTWGEQLSYIWKMTKPGGTPSATKLARIEEYIHTHRCTGLRAMHLHELPDELP
jgi:hypothetical protein